MIVKEQEDIEEEFDITVTLIEEKEIPIKLKTIKTIDKDKMDIRIKTIKTR